MKLHNQVVFVTDADHPSGIAIWKKLAAEGAHLVLCSASRGQAIAQEISQLEQQGARIIAEQVDLCSTEAVDGFLQKAEEHLGPVYVLVHNNNVVKPVSVSTCEEELFQEMLQVNAKTAFITTQAAGRRMAEQQAGRIIYVSSIHAEKPTGSSFAYSVSKGAVQMLSREAALALGRYGVNVNHIQLGPVEGDHYVFYSEISGLYEDYRYKVPSTVLGTYDDLADLVLYLSSDASASINGADIRVDGGFLLHYLDVKTKKPLHLY